MADNRIHDPALGFRFQVTVAGKGVSAGFNKVTGLRDESEVVDYREGTDPIVKRKIPGIRVFPALVLSRGMMADALALIEWREETIACKPGFAATTKVTVHNCDLSPARDAEFQLSWPNVLQLGDLDGGASEVNIETVEIVHEGTLTGSLFSRGSGAALVQSRA